MTRDDSPTNDERETSADDGRDDAATTRADVGRRRYLQATTAAVVGTVGLAGCTGGDGSGGDGGDGSGGDGGDGGSDGGDGGSETGVLSTSVTDDPGDIDDFESCVVTIAGYWLGPEPGAEEEDEEEDAEGTESDDGTATATETTTTEAQDTEDDDEADEEEAEDDDEADEEEADEEESGGRQYYELDEPAQADLVELQDDSTQVIDDRELETGEHAYLQLDTDGVDAVLNDGSDATVEVPGEAPLKFNESFEIRANTRTSFTADFTPVKRGQTGRYLLQPVASGVEVTYEAIESDGSGDGTTEAGDGGETTEAGDSEETTDSGSDDGTTTAAE